MYENGWFLWKEISAEINHFFYKIANLFDVFSKFGRGDVELFFETAIEKARVVKPRNVCDVGNGIGGGKQKIFRIVQSLRQEIFSDRLSHIFLERVANVLFGVGDIFCDFAHGHIVKIGGTEQIQNVLNPAGERRAVELRVVVGHKQQNGRSDASA